MITNIEVTAMQNNQITMNINIIDNTNKHVMSSDIVKKLSRNKEIISVNLSRNSERNSFIKKEY